MMSRRRDIDIDVVVSRHPAAVEFIAAEIGGRVVGDGEQSFITVEVGPRKTRMIPVLAQAGPDDVDGRVVGGNLPLHLAALARLVVAVEFDGEPPRGREYGLPEMRAAGAHLRVYRVRSVRRRYP